MLNPNEKQEYVKLEKLLLLPTATSVTHRYVGLPAYKELAAIVAEDFDRWHRHSSGEQ